MCSQGILPGKQVIADRTFELFICQMSLQMRLEPVLRTETLFALLALELSVEMSVNMRMSLQST